MIIEFLQPHALNMGQDFEYVSTFFKGRHRSIANMRLLIRGVKDGKEYLLGLEPRPDFFGRKICYNIVPIDGYQWISPTHIESHNGEHEYYLYNNNIQTVHDFFTEWLKRDPMVHVGNLTHQFVSAITNYKGSYKFDNKTY